MTLKSVVAQPGGTAQSPNLMVDDIDTGGLALNAELVAQLALLDPSVNPCVSIAGKGTAGDQGGGVFVGVLVAGGPAVDGINVFASSNVLWRWQRDTAAKPIDPAWAGAKGDGVTNDRAALLAASALGQLHLAPGATYAVTTTVTLAGGIRPAGGKIKPAAGQTVYVAGPVHARKEHWIDHSAGGAVAFPLEFMPPEIYPQWWGASGKDDITLATQNRDAFAAMIATMATAPDAAKCTIVIPAGQYYVACDAATGICLDFTGLSHVTVRTQGGQVTFVWVSTAGGAVGGTYERGVMMAVRDCNYCTFEGQVYLQCNHPTDAAKRAHVGLWVCDKWHWTGTRIWGADGATSIPATRELTSALDFVAAGCLVGEYLEVHDLTDLGDNWPYYQIANVAQHVLTVDRNWPVGSLANLSFRAYSDAVGVHTQQSLNRLKNLHVYGALEYGIAVGDGTLRTYNTDCIQLVNCESSQGSAATAQLAGFLLADSNTNDCLVENAMASGCRLSCFEIAGPNNAVVRAPLMDQRYNAAIAEHAQIHIRYLGSNLTLEQFRSELYGAPLLTTQLLNPGGSRITGAVVLANVSTAYAFAAAPAAYDTIRYNGCGSLCLDNCIFYGPRADGVHVTDYSDIEFAPEVEEGSRTLVRRGVQLLAGVRTAVAANAYEVVLMGTRDDAPTSPGPQRGEGIKLISRPSYYLPSAASRKWNWAGNNTVQWDQLNFNPGVQPYLTELVAGRGGTVYKAHLDYRAFTVALQTFGFTWLRGYGVFKIRSILFRLLANFAFSTGEQVQLYCHTGTGDDILVAGGVRIDNPAVPCIFPTAAADLAANMTAAATYYNGGFIPSAAAAAGPDGGFELIPYFWGGKNFGNGAVTSLIRGELEMMVDIEALDLPGERYADNYTCP